MSMRDSAVDYTMLRFRSCEQLDAIKALARESRISLAEWIRRACEQYAKTTGGVEIGEASKLAAKRYAGYSQEVYLSSEFRALEAARQRCENPKAKGHSYYKAKGIKVHPDWSGPDGFDRFFAHIGPKPTPAHTLERIENTKGYEPGNVRWATQAQQVRNTSRTRLLTLDGETLCLTDWASRAGLSPTTLRSRLKRGMTLERALSQKLRE